MSGQIIAKPVYKTCPKCLSEQAYWYALSKFVHTNDPKKSSFKLINNYTCISCRYEWEEGA